MHEELPAKPRSQYVYYEMDELNDSLVRLRAQVERDDLQQKGQPNV